MDLDKYYGYARKIAGKLGEDLLHHVICENGLLEKLKDVHLNAVDRYVYLTLLNEYTNKKSKFYRLYIRPELEPVEIDDAPTKGYDTIPINTILLILELEGYELEVKVFRECYFLNRSELSFSKRSGTDYRAIQKMCKFVKNEIRKRYVLELD
tara:strand:- start:2695 stop:3153 length:459 start_codon:yes stop_codon:yes gene_type:complete